MTQIDFYHLQRSSLEDALPKLLELTLKAEKRALVRTDNPAKVEALNAHLWTYDEASWLPHGAVKNGSASEQPIWLSAETDNPNNADFLFLTDGVAGDDVAGFERGFDLFDGNEDAALTAARERWKKFKQLGHDLHYWQQDDYGKWVERA